MKNVHFVAKSAFFARRKVELQTLLVEKSVQSKVRIQFVEYEEVWIFLVENEEGYEVWILLVNPPCGADCPPRSQSSLLRPGLRSQTSKCFQFTFETLFILEVGSCLQGSVRGKGMINTIY